MSILMANKSQMMVEVEAALDHVRPHLAVDGGDVELVDITVENVVLIRWLGACKNCNMTQMTLKAGIEEVVRNKVPEIKSIQSIDEPVL
jgi:Fe-S cluster biogenesis protein NfuA